MDIQYVNTTDEEPVVIDDNYYKVYTPTITPINVKLFTFDTDKSKSDAREDLEFGDGEHETVFEVRYFFAVAK
ncbi:unnamed protein product [Phytophthora lilii]|uniref:Unnamed protein product n=1 Tax=Phytophthora lilii TaxID=2077276 RepID=A0A9W6U374_9STRA|nr:unnamed protein product [Phytophthora lilii]